MIKKEKFFEILDYLQENQKFEDNLRQLFDDSSKITDFMDGAMFTDLKMTDYLIYLLEDEYEDHADGWISYWIYELNFGQRWTPGSIKTKNGKEIKLQTKEDLYILLINNIFDDMGMTD